MKRTKEDAEQTREAILDSALTIFSQVGYQASRLKDIAQKADVTRGAIYHHFENKAGLFMALVEDANMRGNKVLEQAIQEGGNFLDILTRILVYGMELLEDDRRFREITTLALFETGNSDELSDYQDQLKERNIQTVGVISGFFQMGIENGEVRTDIDPSSLARAFLAYQNGLSLLWITNPNSFSIKADASQLARIFAQGISR